MIKGKYVFKVNGEIVFEKDNVITTNGLYMINKYLTQSAVDWAGSMAVGVLGTTSASTDTKLAYEVYRSPVTLKSYTTTSGSNQVVLKSTIGANIAMQIYEIGIFPSNTVAGTNKDNAFLTKFDEINDTTSSISGWTFGPTEATASLTTTTSSTTSRVGKYNVSPVSTASSLTKNNVNINVSSYNTSDYLEFLYFVPNGKTGTSPSITFTLKDYASVSWTSASVNLPTTSSGYYSASIAMSNTPGTNFSYNIDRITASMTGGTGSIQFGALKFMSGAVKPPELKLTSRTSSSAIMVDKTYGQPMDIEYYLTVT